MSSSRRDKKVSPPRRQSLARQIKSAAAHKRALKEAPDTRPLSPQEVWQQALRGVTPLAELKGKRQKVVMVTRRAPKTALKPFVIEHDDEWIAAHRDNARALTALRRVRNRAVPTLDLHGLRVAEAQREMQLFVQQAIKSSLRVLLIIHGKGLHAEDGWGVLRDHVINALQNGALSIEVEAFCTAPAALGGTGALLLLLR